MQHFSTLAKFWICDSFWLFVCTLCSFIQYFETTSWLNRSLIAAFSCCLCGQIGHVSLYCRYGDGIQMGNACKKIGFTMLAIVKFTTNQCSFFMLFSSCLVKKLNLLILVNKVFKFGLKRKRVRAFEITVTADCAMTPEHFHILFFFYNKKWRDVSKTAVLLVLFGWAQSICTPH